jgi:hypothetical protein
VIQKQKLSQALRPLEKKLFEKYKKEKDNKMVRVIALASSMFTYLLTPWSRVLLEKITVNFAACQEIPRIYGTRKFLTVPTSARHLSSSMFTLLKKY